MREFVATFGPLLDRATRRRLVWAAIGAVGVAAIEAAALLLVVPLVQVITQANTGQIPSSAQWVADRIHHPTPLAVAGVLGLVVFAAFVVKGVASLLYLRWNLTFILQSEAAMSRRLLRAYLHAPYSFHLQRNSADLQRTAHDNVRRVYQDAIVAFVGGSADAVLIAAVALVLIAIEPVIALCAALYFLLVALGYQRLIHGRASAAGEEIERNVSDAYRVVQQSLGAIKDVQIRHSQDVFVDELGRIKEGSARRFRTLLLLNQTPRYYLEIALIVGVGLMAAALYPTRTVASATAVLSLFLAAGFRMLPSLNRVLVALAAIKASQPALDRIAGDLRELEQPGMAETNAEVEPLEPRPVEFRHVTFRYGPTLPSVLEDVSFRIEPGESVAFVGASGAGKSTLLDVLLGLLQPTSGTIHLGNDDLASVSARWQRSVGYVPQDVAILDDTVRNNIALGVPDEQVDKDSLARAINMAQLTDAISDMADGVRTRLGERGTRLSGGQRQRVGIARALYLRPNVLVLDEATSSLDSATELRITETVEALRGVVTLVIVTHRLSTVRNCDRIYVLDGRTVAGEGTFAELTRSNRGFAELVRLASVETAPDPT